jgi:DNA repair ATPase RecN
MAKQEIGNLRIVSLVAENVKKLVALEINPNDDIVTISGKNGAGKSSVLDCIWWALTGTANIQSQPIRKGENKARIRLTLKGKDVELVVERRFTEKASTLIVESADGARFGSPQGMLDALIGQLSFDPLAFARMDPEDQFDELRRIVPLEVDLDNLDALNKGDYDKRTDANREAKALRARAQAITVAADLPAEPVDEAALLTEMEQASAKNTEIETRKANRARAQEQANDSKRLAGEHRNRAAKLREEAAAADKQASDLLDQAAALEKKIDDAEPLPAPVDVADIRVKLEHARQINAKIKARNERADLEQSALGYEAQAQKLTEQMDARTAEKGKAIAAAKMPIPGLSFGDGIVTYNGVPFEQASSAEQLKVSLSIAMAANPKLRVIRIQDGSLLDDASLATIAEMAKEGDYQVWIERVDTTGKLGVYIEDGAVVAVDGEPVPPASPAKKAAKAAA